MFRVYKQLPNSTEMAFVSEHEDQSMALDAADTITRNEGVATQVEESDGGQHRIVATFGSLAVPDPTIPAPPVTPPSAIAFADFLRLFTLEERVAIRSAAMNNMVIADYMNLAQAQGYVKLGSAEAQNGIWYLVQQQLLTELRAQEILGQL